MGLDRRAASAPSTTDVNAFQMARSVPGRAPTVRAVFSSRTPSSAQRSSVASWPTSTFSSRCNSARMQPRECGRGAPAGTENASPHACTPLGYGSWPRMTARTFAGFVVLNARNTSSRRGKAKPWSALARHRSIGAGSSSSRRVPKKSIHSGVSPANTLAVTTAVSAQGRCRRSARRQSSKASRGMTGCPRTA